jgi:hypothetical protein
MKRRLKLVCASNDDHEHGFHTAPCSGKACGWWSKVTNRCTAGEELSSEELYGRWFTAERDAKMPPCPIADRCTWNVDAIKRGEPGCGVRRLGLVCEHQGGEWRTWDMAEADDPIWGKD